MKGVKKGVKKVVKGVGDVVKGAAKVFKKIVTSKIFWAVVAVAAIAYGGWMYYQSAGLAANVGAAGAVNGATATGAISGTGAAAGAAGSTATLPVAGAGAAGAAGAGGAAAAAAPTLAPLAAPTINTVGGISTAATTAGGIGSVAPAVVTAGGWTAPLVPNTTTSLLEKFVNGGKTVSSWIKDNPLPTAVGMQMAGAAMSPDEMDMQEQRQEWLEEDRQRRESNLTMVGIRPGVRPTARPDTRREVTTDSSQFAPTINTGQPA